MSLTASIEPVAEGVVRLRHLFVNAYLIGNAERWVLVDAALPGSDDDIVEAAEATFGTGATPSAIVLTHGHFDHVGGLTKLLERWEAPVFAHTLELPHLTGRQDYPPPDPTVGKGAMALLSFTYPNGAIDLGERVSSLPDDGSVPFLSDWRWVHTPGHTGGHVSLFRERDGLLVAGDAFVTVEQESLYKVMTQKQEVHGPPAYFTPDWTSAERSVRALAELRPTVAATGHGTPMSGDALSRGLANLIAHFDEIAIPDHGRYVPDSTKSSAP